MICSTFSFLVALVSATDGNQVLKEMDASMNAAKDLSLTYELIDEQKGRTPRKMGMKVLIKGDMRITEFTAPADMKGTKVLVKSPTQMYIYMPAYKKVRRIASHVTNQGFMGMTYSNDDLALNRYGDKYQAKLLGEDQDVWRLEAKAKSKEAPYAKVLLTVDRKMKQPIKLEFYDDGGNLLKTETRKNFDCQGEVCAPGEMTMVDHRTDGHSSTLRRKSWKVNPGLSDRVFSKRYLQRGR